MERIWTVAGIALITLSACSPPADTAADVARMEEPALGRDNIAYIWGGVALEATANDTENNKPRPTVNSRMLALPMVAQFDAWSRFDSLAVPVYLKAGRRPAGEHTEANKAEAISYAMARALTAVYPADSQLFADKLAAMGYDPAYTGMDPATPAGIGNLAAHTVVEARRHDGSNMFGDHPDADTLYGDYTHYGPVNPAEKLSDIDRWQPKYFVEEGTGRRYAPDCLSPHWRHVRPLFLDSASQFRPPAPPVMGDPKLEAELREVVAMQAGLTNEEKALVEFMRDGPRSVQQAGHWLIFARDVSVRDAHTLDQDVKMYFVVASTAMDCFIACWDAKMHYDNSRPYQQVHHLLGDEDIKGWGGPHAGMIAMKGRDWRPYSPESFLCPPFPAYPSGHSTVSGGCSKALELFTGSDNYGATVTLLPGWLTEPGITQDSVTLEFPTFTRTAEMAGRSRVLGGYHIETDNVEGLRLGRSVGELVYTRCMAHIEGRAGAPREPLAAAY